MCRVTAALAVSSGLLLAAALGGPGCSSGGGGQSVACVKMPGCEQISEVCCNAATICTQRVCQGLSLICGVGPGGSYTWRNKAAPCDDNNPCTSNDLCVGGRCQGTPTVCNTPPPNTCQGNDLVIAGEGTCSAQAGCVYQQRRVTCPSGCQGDRCAGDPCLGITCNEDKGPCYERPGTCEPLTGGVSLRAQAKRHQLRANGQVHRRRRL